jgi:hypothetical protein
MLFSFFGEPMCELAVAAFVGGVGAVEAGGAIGGFLASEVAEAVVFFFRRVGLGVVECCVVVSRCTVWGT